MAIITLPIVRLVLILTAFFISGGAALIYQTLWVRSFSLTLGHTTLAVSSVLASFMGGLSLGSFISSKLLAGSLLSSKKERDYFLYFSITQIGIGLFAGLFSPYVINFLPSFIIKKIPYLVITAPEILRGVLWFVISFTILIVPTTLLGLTLPFLVRAVSREFQSFSSDFIASSRIVSLLIGVNTLGAIGGVILAGFYLIKNLGMLQSYRLAALFNLISCVLVFLVYLSKKNNRASASEIQNAEVPLAPQKEDLTETSTPEPIFYKIISLVLFISGAAAMMAEVGWTRTFAMVLGSSTYAFSIMLGTFLGGFSLGNFVWNIISSSIRVKSETIKRYLFLPFLLAGISIIAYLPLVNYLPYFFVRAFNYIMASQSVLVMRLVEFILGASVMFLPTFFMGLIFPWAIAVLPAQRNSSSNLDADFISKKSAELTGRFQSINTLGNIFGSAIAGIFLIRFIGTEKALVVAAILYIVSAAVMFYFTSTFYIKKKIYILSIVIIFLTIVLKTRPNWDPYIMTSGMFTYANLYRDFNDYRFLLRSLRTNWLLYYKDGVSANVAVFQTPWKERFMRINGKTDASSAGDMSTQMLLGYIPTIILRTNPPQDILIIGLGSGITAGSISVVLKGTDTIANIECVEIEPAVYEAAKFFTALNHQILDKPFFHIIFTDARHYLTAANKKYDIIISEPSNPWISGIANLFTVEAFKLGAERLKSDGVFCQWLQSYSISEDDFKLVMRTFASVFKKVALFATAQNDYLLVGTNNPDGFQSDYLKIKEDFEMNYRFARDMEYIGIHKPFSLITSTFILDDREFREYAFGGGYRTDDIHSDEKPTIEFTTPLYLYKNENEKIAASIESLRGSFSPDWIKNMDTISAKEKALLYNDSAESFLRQKKIQNASALLEEALKIDNKNPRIWVNLGRVENLLDNHLKAEKMFKRATELDPNYPLAWFHLGMLYLLQGMKNDGRLCLEKGLRLSPGDPMGSYYLSNVYIEEKLYDEAKAVLTKALAKPIWDAELRNSLLDNLSMIENLTPDGKKNIVHN